LNFQLTATAKFGIEAAIMRTLIVVVLLWGTGCGVVDGRHAPPPPRDVAVARAPRAKHATSRRVSSRAKASGRTPSAVSRGGCPAGAVAAVVAQVNAERAAKNLRPLVADPELTRAAESRARGMAASNRLSHSGWEQAIRGEVSVASAMGENVAYNYSTATAVVDGWMRSAGHRRNILDRSFRRVGVGCVADARDHLWWAQDFAD